MYFQGQTKIKSWQKCTGRSNNGLKVSCLRIKVPRPGLKPTLCWSETPELEFGAVSATTHQIHCLVATNFIQCKKVQIMFSVGSTPNVQ